MIYMEEDDGKVVKWLTRACLVLEFVRGLEIIGL
jgi:hypothetical protein